MTTGPTKEFVESTLKLSQEFLGDSLAVLEQKRLRSTVDRAYYSIHYAAIALLAPRGIKPPRSHRGLVNIFGREIVNRGVLDKDFSTMLSGALRDRMQSTYDSEAEITLGDARSTVADAEKFLDAVRSILRL